MERNCFFLATSRESLLQAAAIIELWQQNMVEAVIPPPLPFHIFAQQIMALALQERGIGVSTWRAWIGRMPGFADFSTQQIEGILQYMIKTEILSEDEGILWLGDEGESTFGRRNFLELFSVFTSPPLFSVLHGQTELGSVHEFSFLARDTSKPILLLGGRSWQVTHIEWSKRVAWVQPADEQGRSRWLGAEPRSSFKLCQAICRILASTTRTNPAWSHRAQIVIAEARSDFDWISEQATTLVTDQQNGTAVWWTFGGLCANSQLATSLKSNSTWQVSYDNLKIKFQTPTNQTELREKIAELHQPFRTSWQASDLANYLDDLKFSICIPRDLATLMMNARLEDNEAVNSLLSETNQAHPCRRHIA